MAEKLYFYTTGTTSQNITKFLVY